MAATDAAGRGYSFVKFQLSFCGYAEPRLCRRVLTESPAAGLAVERVAADKIEVDRRWNRCSLLKRSEKGRTMPVSGERLLPCLLGCYS
jgi:hypothetical protein